MLYNVFEHASKSFERSEMIFTDFFNKYFWNGIKYDAAYNWIDTLTYSAIFVGFLWLLYSKVFEKKKIIVDRQFIFALVGWLIFGSSMRAAEDAGIFKTVLLITPFFYITVFAIAFPLLLAALKFNKTVPYWKSWGVSGYVLGAMVLFQLPLKNANGLLLSFGIWALWAAVFWVLHRVKPKILGRWNFAALCAQMFDASSTFAALTFYPGFWEKHVLGSTLIAFFESRNLLLINGSASWVMFALKLAVVPFVLYAIDKYGETNNEKNFLKMVILMLGFAVGLRNTLEIGMA